MEKVYNDSITGQNIDYREVAIQMFRVAPNWHLFSIRLALKTWKAVIEAARNSSSIQKTGAVGVEPARTDKKNIFLRHAQIGD